MVAETHPLFGRLLQALSFKRLNGIWHLVVELPDGSPGTIPADATDVFGAVVAQRDATVLSVEGVRQLQRLVTTLQGDGGRRRARSRRTSR